jgi:uncharacterized membrane protein (DUF485 family)
MESNFRAESRFRYYNYYFYIGGVPLFNTSASKFYQMYVVFCCLCAYSTILAMFMAIYHSRENLDEAMNVAMLFLVFSFAMCTQLYFR